MKIRIEHSHNGLYKIQISRWWGWEDINKFCYIGASSSEAVNCWNPVFLNAEAAERFAIEIKKPDGLREHYRKENEKEQRWIRERTEYLNRIAPFESKII